MVAKIELSEASISFLTKSGINSKAVTLAHGAEPFMRSCQLCSYSRTSQRFMKPEGSLLRSQEPSTGPYCCKHNNEALRHLFTLMVYSQS
jgi:hypothetical protein